VTTAAREESVKLNVPALSVEESCRSFETRRARLLDALITSAGPDPHAERAIAHLVTGCRESDANERIRAAAEWFDHAPPAGRTLRGECGFTAMALCRGHYLPGASGRLTPATRDAIARFFTTEDFRSGYPSENHHLAFHTSRYLMACAYPDATFAAYRRTAGELAAEDREWLRQFIRFRARRGWSEFDSTRYVATAWDCLITLRDFSADAELGRLAGMMLDLLLADVAVDSLHGLYGGAHGRTKTAAVHDHATAPTYAMQYLYFGNVDPATVRGSVPPGALWSAYRPPAIVVDIALDRPQPYVNLERKQLHNPDDVLPRRPTEGSIRKYSYCTPDYILGCVQKQDSDPAGRPGWHAHFQQQEWDLTIGTRTSSRLFTHHPGRGGLHHYWTGDSACGCGRFLQHEGALVGLYDIPDDEACQFIHGYVPRHAFDEVRDQSGVVFVREGRVVGALRMLPRYEWTRDGVWRDVEIISRGCRHAVICEVACLADVGSFERFRQEILANHVEFDRERLIVAYHSARYGHLRLDGRGRRELNGRDVPLDYPTYHSPCVSSAWDSGIVTMMKGDRALRLDFAAPA